jgi:hypothetical protein
MDLLKYLKPQVNKHERLRKGFKQLLYIIAEFIYLSNYSNKIKIAQS